MITPVPLSSTAAQAIPTIFKTAIKTATPDIVQFNDEDIVSNAEIITDLLFENIGGQELINIARYDTVNGQSISYQPIKNLNIIQQEYNPNNILKLQKTSDRIFANFPIKLENKIPNQASGPNAKNVYLDANGDLVIELINIEADEQVEVQITSSGTIYEADI